MNSQLHLLKSNAVVNGPTPTAAYHTISVKNEETGCRVQLAATKPFMEPIHAQHHGLKDQAVDFVWFSHDPNHCYCAPFSTAHDTLFKTWQHIHMTLRRKADDNASYAFYPEFEYESGEALAHASLVASLAVGKTIPACYEYLIKDFGASNLRDEFFPDEHRSDYDSDYDSDDSDDSDGSDDSWHFLPWSELQDTFGSSTPSTPPSTPPSQ